ncbi:MULTISPECIES: DUF5819 family protein [unclassified Streptomyces]|uniref:DUF5819 family protein n=1 Tax=unclassified Streptomyces TaxID=2593676 RepID=UPI002258B83E|nr:MULTISPECIES: DUF5819 family protein [unclassified Streptomyces]MCX5055672.1 DUF5819 family protein [Streptomyces sp. NBC_00452]MCX5286737.1 DUF5819 family protein [Streptomyces sp. NBC_00183]
MDAYGTDSDARRGPDGPGGAPDPGEAPEASGPSEPDGSLEAGGPSEPDGSPEADGPREPDGRSDLDGSPAADGGPKRIAGSKRIAGPDTGGADLGAWPPAGAAPAPAPAPAPDSTSASTSDPGPHLAPRTGVAALSPRYQIGAALALAVVAVVVCVHVGMVFLHVSPANTLTKAHGKAIDDWIYPEFEQNWKLFAPNPLQQNIALQVRAEVQAKNGELRTTGWYDLSAEDGRAIDGNLLPSHTQQNELRRAWDFFVATHDSTNRSTGLRGTLSESYLRRIVMLRLDRDDVSGNGGVIEQVQVRSRTTNVPPPKWSTEKISDKPMDRVLPWWLVTAADTDGGAE